MTLDFQSSVYAKPVTLEEDTAWDMINKGEYKTDSQWKLNRIVSLPFTVREGEQREISYFIQNTRTYYSDQELKCTGKSKNLKCNGGHVREGGLSLGKRLVSYFDL